MSKNAALASTRTNFRSSHLRQVSISSSTARSESSNHPGRLVEQPADNAQYEKLSEHPFDQIYSLWIHDESFSTDDVLINTSQIHANNIKGGDLMQILPLKNPVKYEPNNNDNHQQVSKNQANKRGPSNDRKSNSSFSTSVVGGHPVDLARRHIFTVKETDSNQNAKQPGLQVCCISIGSLGFR